MPSHHRSATAEHRPAAKPRRFAHDDLIAVDLFSGFGGLTRGIEMSGFTTILAANHDHYKIQVHEANHPAAEHWIADLVDPDAADYHSPRDLPAGDLLVAGVSCVNHSAANSQRAYEQGLSLFDLEDPDYEDRVTRSERDRATANCVLHYADTHHPRMILVECTTELTSWGMALPGRAKVGDGSTYRWWLRQFDTLGYDHRVLYLNSMFFGVPQSRDRLYIVFWDRRIPAPDLDHRPATWCPSCDQYVQAVWSWKTGVPASGTVRYGRQYNYCCPHCRREVHPPAAPSLAALDLTDLGTRIGDRDKPLAASTMARAERCRQRFTEFPAVLVPHSGISPVDHPWKSSVEDRRHQPDSLLSTAALMVTAGNRFERPGSNCRTRDLSQPLWAQTATNSTSILAPPTAMPIDATQVQHASMLSSGVVPFRKHTRPTGHSEAMPTVTGGQIPGLLTAAGVIKNNGNLAEAKYRAHPVSSPLGTVVASGGRQSLLFSGWFKQNGSTGAETAPHPASDPLGTLTSRDTTALLHAQWQQAVSELPLEDCYFRMMSAHEVGRGCGFDVDFPGHTGTFIVWGSAHRQVDGYGNAVSPQVGEWIGARLRDALHAGTFAA